MGYLLALGIFGSYVPQHVKIIKRRSSEGLSPEYLFCGVVSAFAAFLNIVIVSSDARSCCLHGGLTFWQCSNSLISLAQISLQSVGCFLIMILCVYVTRDSVIEYKKDFKDLVKFYHYWGLFCFVSVVVMFYIWIFQHQLLMPFADLMGIISTTMALIQFFPQLYKTYQVKHPGTLSIPTMILQTPGGFFWTYSMYSQPNSKWSTYLPYLTSAILQGTLLVMCLYFQSTKIVELDELATDFNIMRQNEILSHQEGDETTPLM